MARKGIVFSLFALALWAGPASAADIPVITANAVVEKASRDSVTVLPRRADGRFDKSLVMRVSGTTTITIVGTRMQGRKLIFTQRGAKVQDLEKNQKVSIIYVRGKESNLLLAAVAQPK
jgi:hypothetical protein